MPSRRRSSAIEVSPRRASSTTRIFSSAAWCFNRNPAALVFSDQLGAERSGPIPRHRQRDLRNANAMVDI
jgi:hypothetical protein